MLPYRLTAVSHTHTREASFKVMQVEGTLREVIKDEKT